ncbi:MAG: glycosyltransferase [Candidatus Micrarchaeota archaeon]
MPIPKVSIIVPPRNKADFVGLTLASVRAQDFQDWEALVIDNRSSDGSQDVVKKLATADKRIRFIQNEEDIGIVGSLNRGLDEAKGEYVAVLHSDDLWEKNFLPSSIALLGKNPTAGLCFCKYKNIDEKGGQHKIEARNRLAGESRLVPSREMFSLLIERDFMPVCTVLVRRDAHEKCGNYDPQFPGPSDYMMWLKIAYRFDGIYNADTTSSYRIYGSNDTNYLIDNNISIMEQYSMVKKLFRNYIPQGEEGAKQEKAMLRNAALSLLRQASSSIARGKGGLCRSQCGLAGAVWGGLPEHLMAFVLYVLSYFTFILAPFANLAIRIALPLLRKMGKY